MTSFFVNQTSPTIHPCTHYFPRQFLPTFSCPRVCHLLWTYPICKFQCYLGDDMLVSPMCIQTCSIVWKPISVICHGHSWSSYSLWGKLILKKSWKVEVDFKKSWKFEAYFDIKLEVGYIKRRAPKKLVSKTKGSPFFFGGERPFLKKCGFFVRPFSALFFSFFVSPFFFEGRLFIGASFFLKNKKKSFLIFSFFTFLFLRPSAALFFFRAHFLKKNKKERFFLGALFLPFFFLFRALLLI